MGKTNSADQALVQYESGQTLVPTQAMTDSGDHLTFSITAKPWSGKAGKEPVIRPDGLATGGAVSPKVGNDDMVTVAALTCYLAGVSTAVASGDLTAVRALTTDTHNITSLTVTSAGALAAVSGLDSTSFSEVRGAAGGPPLIPVGSIEIGQVRLSSTAAADVAAAEIFQVPGSHQERYDFPIWDEDSGQGQVTFAAALPLIHTGTVAKAVSAEVYTPIFATIDPTSDFVPPETSHSQSSQQVYGGTIGSSSSSLSQGSFTAYLKDGVTDQIVKIKNETLWFRMYPHRLKAPYILCQGKLGIGRTFPAGNAMRAACTISADSPAIDMEA
jgi:hypothetical protein